MVEVGIFQQEEVTLVWTSVGGTEHFFSSLLLERGKDAFW